MPFSTLRAVALALCMLVLALPALAKSPVGTWRLDEAAYRAQVDAMFERMLANVPPEQREQARRMMQGSQDPLESALASRVEFRDDGSVVATEGDDPTTERIGTWREDGAEIVMSASAAEPDTPDMIGVFDGDRLIFRFAPDASQHGAEEMAWMSDFRITLVRE